MGKTGVAILTQEQEFRLLNILILLLVPPRRVCGGPGGRGPPGSIRAGQDPWPQLGRLICVDPY